MECHRICRRVHRPLDGEGARRYGGRWNSPGLAVVYASASLALAALEFLVHLDSSEAPRDLLAMRITIPDDLSVSEVKLRSLPARWDRYPAADACRRLGDAWLAAGKTAVLKVPSAPVREEWNVLLNPRHADFQRIKEVSVRRFQFDQRLVR